MDADSGEMKAALKKIVIPVLRNKGFKGSFPHFRRILSERIDLLTFQFDKWSGGFIIEISTCPTSGHITYWGEQISPSKVTAHDLHPNQRERLQAYPGSGTDAWFRFENGAYLEVANSVLPKIDIAEDWWQNRFLTHHSSGTG